MGGFERADAVLHDVPVQDLFVYIGELDATGELREVSVLLDQRLRIEDDGRVEILLRDLIIDGAAELGFDFVVGQAEVETDAGELDAFAKIDAVPERVRAVGFLDYDQRRLAGGEDAGLEGRRGGRVDHIGINAGVARAGAALAILNERLGDLEV